MKKPAADSAPEKLSDRELDQVAGGESSDEGNTVYLSTESCKLSVSMDLKSPKCGSISEIFLKE